MISLPALLLNQSPDREAGRNVFSLCRKVCQISSVSLTGTRAFFKESATKAQTPNKSGFKEQEVLLDLLQYGPTLLQSFAENAEVTQRTAHPTTHWNYSYNLQTQLTLGATDTAQLGLRVFARAAPASPVPCPTHGTSSHKPAATAAGRGSARPR